MEGSEGEEEAGGQEGERERGEVECFGGKERERDKTKKEGEDNRQGNPAVS